MGNFGPKIIKYFGPKMSLFFTFFQKTENRPLLAHQKGHNF
jgi:hypothetical protein